MMESKVFHFIWLFFVFLVHHMTKMSKLLKTFLHFSFRVVLRHLTKAKDLQRLQSEVYVFLILRNCEKHFEITALHNFILFSVAVYDFKILVSLP